MTALVLPSSTGSRSTGHSTCEDILHDTSPPLKLEHITILAQARAVCKSRAPFERQSSRPQIMSSFAKSKLKAARDALGKKKYEQAREAAAQVLDYEPDNYTAYVPNLKECVVNLISTVLCWAAMCFLVLLC